MGKRYDALMRIWAVVYTFLIGGVAQFVAMVVGFVFGGVDVLWQGVTGMEGLGPNNVLLRLPADVYEWNAENMAFAFSGRGSFAWLP